MILSEEQKAEIAAHTRRYNELKAAGQEHAPRALPAPTARDAASIDADTVIHRETIPSGWYWTTRLNRGDTLRIVNTSGTSTVSLLAWNSADTTERLNHADTIKVQWAARLQKGRVLLSDMGRALLGITEDSSAAHDAVVGGSTAATNVAKYGDGNFRNTRDNFILAAAKLGLDRRDVHPCVSFFAPVAIDADGKFVWSEQRRQQGDFVDLRAEMELLIALSNCPHPLDPAKAYPQASVEIVRYRAAAPAADDLCRTATAEAARAYENNALYLGEALEGAVR
ncbi:urea carboxylase-associated protein 2 [Bradyrhizobium sp. USDA 4532]|uniref:urea amidolyase associated protein UAAP1 n=1 Tax=unclassified Bradyrhizobium TaxID=2631580 RepID=UPI0020A0D3FC|nr:MULTISPECIES: urea amidolyase associated protein UAAP1 [unclassified Bradyrhizobium]MCP1836213.1 urea carboxylase-associated protein 2 [Bradyrhizobium sp. USDA 4545]MCP1920962.1 urea carboxylase-associated protein 2 [Bradyrhizobium sp. USDA 4532]